MGPRGGGVDARLPLESPWPRLRAGLLQGESAPCSAAIAALGAALPDSPGQPSLGAAWDPRCALIAVGVLQASALSASMPLALLFLSFSASSRAVDLTSDSAKPLAFLFWWWSGRGG